MCRLYVIIHICDMYMAHTHTYTYGNIRQVVRNFSVTVKALGLCPLLYLGYVTKENQTDG